MKKTAPHPSRAIFFLGALLIATPLLLRAVPVSAREATPKRSAADTTDAIHPVYAPDGLFAFCALPFPQPEGRKATIAEAPSGEINIGLTIPQGGFVAGQRYDLEVAAGPSAPRKIRTEAVSEDSLLAKMGKDPSFGEELRESQTLTTKAGGTTLTFFVADMKKNMAKLHDCVKKNEGKKNPNAAKEAAEMPETLRALLVSAGLTKAEPLDLSSIPPAERPADYAWKLGKTLGGVREREIPKGETAESLIGLHFEGLKKKCNGAFTSSLEREQRYHGVSLQTATVRCERKAEGKNTSVNVAILFYRPDPTRLTTFTHEALDSEKPEAFAARDALLKTLRRMAETMKGGAN